MLAEPGYIVRLGEAHRSGNGWEHLVPNPAVIDAADPRLGARIGLA